MLSVFKEKNKSKMQKLKFKKKPRAERKKTKIYNQKQNAKHKSIYLLFFSL